MNQNRSLMARAVRSALIASTVTAGAGFTGAALAQQQQMMEEVVITGSRLRRDRDFVEVSPVATVDMEQIQGLGNLTLEATLNRMPQLTPDTNGQTNQYGGPAMSANLRGLGPERTLVLVDGRRYIPAENTGITDLATIPDMLVERIEIVTGGASAVYGSDAIAGAINFRLRDDFQGAEVRYQRGETSRNDGDTERLDILLGAGTEDGRGNVAVVASYAERGQIMGDSRAFSRQPLIANGVTGVYEPFGAGNIPGGVIALQPAQFGLINGVDLSNANGACPGPIQGVRFDAGSQPVPFCRPTDGFNYAADNFLLRPMERWQISTIGKYRISDNVEAYGQVFYTKYEQAFQMAPEAVNPTSFGQRAGTVVIPNAANNPLFNQTLRDFWAQNAAFWDADGDGTFVVNGVGRRFEEFGPRNFAFNIDSFMLTGGFRGDFDIGENNWAWDTFYQFARNDTTQTNIGLLSRSGITLGLDVVQNANGTVSCRTQIRGCVPVNIFGTDALTPAMSNYLQTESITRNQFDREVAGASIAGDLFELPAGKVSSAFGVEYRKEAIVVEPNEAQLTNDIASQAIAPTIVDGEYDIFEAFAEVRVPILNDQFGVQGLAFEGAVRYADYSTVGTVYTWSGMGDLDVNEQLKIRGGYSRAIRAPNLNELLRPVSSGFRPVTDPCVAVNNPSAAVKQLCIQQGVPANVIDTLVEAPNSGFQQISGGNINLGEETADTLTLGFVLTPSMIQGLSLSLDYYRIELEDAIAQVDGQQLLNDCFRGLNINSVSCQSVVRLPGQGTLLEVFAPLLNLASREVEGVDLTIAYSFENLPSWMALPNHGATLDVQSFSSWQLLNESQVLASLPALDCAGRYSGTCSSGPVRPNPGFRSLLRFNYQSGPMRLSPELSYIGELKLARDSAPNERGTQDAVVYVNLNGGWDITDKIGVFFGVNNLLDKQAPVWAFQAAGDLNVNVNLYDTQGRSYFLGVKATF
jgi:iron complex outermembrane recepter protein